MTYRNANGTYDGAAMLSDVSGLSKEEVRWTFDRMKQLMHEEGKTKAEAKRIVANEGRLQPWRAAE